MNKYGLQIVSFEITTIYNIQIDDIWIGPMCYHNNEFLSIEAY